MAAFAGTAVNAVPVFSWVKIIGSFGEMGGFFRTKRDKARQTKDSDLRA